MLENEEDIFLAKALLDTLRPLALTWLEASVLLHYYFWDWPLDRVAEAAHCHIAEVLAARRSLVSKAAVALGYATEQETGVYLERFGDPIEERRRKVRQLHAQGLSNCEIARRLGISESTVRRDLLALKKAS